MTTATTPSTMPEEWDRRLTSRAERYAAGRRCVAKHHIPAMQLKEAGARYSSRT